MNDKFTGHTPPPWVAHDRGIGWEIHGATGEAINGGFRDTFSRADAELCAAAPELLAENERLHACLIKANSQAENFEREWYLRGDENERLRNRVAELEQNAYLQHGFGGAP